MKKTKIICTVGPASNNAEVISKMINAGMNVARLNMSHGTHESHLGYISIIKEIRQSLNKPVGIMLDTKGPEFRIKQFEKGYAVLKEGETFVLTTGNVKGDENSVSVTEKSLPQMVKHGDRILLNDGYIELQVESVTKYDIITTIIRGGKLLNNKSINLPGIEVNLNYLSQQDKEDMLFGIKNDLDYFSLSFVRNADDVQTVRKFIDANGGSKKHIKLISKIENCQGISNIDEIIEASDGIMIARGDLGVEVDLKMVPIYQKAIAEKCLKAGKIVIVATEMLESMIINSRPTRAEVNDVASAVLDGATAVMLSGETASGEYPVEAVQTMNDIIEKCEAGFVINTKSAIVNEFSDNTSNITFAAKALANEIQPKAILVETVSGNTAYKLSAYRPNCLILACTCDEKVFNQLALCWGTYAVKIKKVFSTDELLDEARQVCLKEGFIAKGDKIIQTAGLPIGVGETNLLKVDDV